MTVYKFECTNPDCGKSFKRKDYLIRHEANHSAIKSFHCKTCDAYFARKDLIEKHKTSKSHVRKERLTSQGSGPVFVNLFLKPDSQFDKETEKYTNNRLASSTPPVTVIKTKSTEHSINSHNQPQNIIPTVASNTIKHHNTTDGVSSNKSKHEIVGSNVPSPLTRYSEADINGILNFDSFSNIEDLYGWLFGNDLAPLTNDYNNNETSEMFNYATADHIDFDSSESDCILADEACLQIRELVVGEMGLTLSSDSLLSSENIAKSMSHYWKYYDPSYPVIHKPTFQASCCDDRAYLLLTLVLLTVGMTFKRADEAKYPPDYLLAIEIHKQLKVILFIELEKFQDFDAVPLQLLQALVLTDSFNFYLGSTYQHKSAHIYHPMVMNLFKELKMYVNLAEPPLDENDTCDEYQWMRWVEYESRKRVAYLGYLLDAQSAFFYAKNQCVSIFDIQLELPYTDSAWYAFDPIEFINDYRRQPKGLVSRDRNTEVNGPYVLSNKDFTMNGVLIPNVKSEGRWPNFLWSLRRLMQPYTKNQKEYEMDCFPQYSRYILLHGVLSLVREQRNISVLDIKIVPKDSLTVIAAKIEQAFLSWRGYFHKQIAYTNAASLHRDPSVTILNDYGSSPLFWSNILMLNIGLLGLYCDFDVLKQLRTNVRKSEQELNSSLGVPSPERVRFNTIEKTKSEMMVSSWAKSRDGYHSNIEACNLLRMIFSNEDIITMVPHAPFAIYMSALVCWFYQSHGGDQHTSSGSLDILTQSDLIEERAMSYLSLNLEHKGELEKLGIESVNDHFGGSRYDMVRALALYSIATLERFSQWANTNTLIDDLCNLLQIEV